MQYWVAKRRKLFIGLWNAKEDDKREGNRDQIIKRFLIHVKEVRLSAGANFLVCLTGTILTLPGLPKVPQAVKMENE